MGTPYEKASAQEYFKKSYCDYYSAVNIICTGSFTVLTQQLQVFKDFNMVNRERPIDLGSEETYFLTRPNEQIGTLSSNCDEKKRGIQERFDVAKFGPCSHPTSVDADAYALSTLVPQVIADGGVINTQAGHETVKNTSGGPAPITWNTYLSYAAGDQLRS